MLPVKYLFFYFSFPFLLSIDSVTESAIFLSQTLRGGICTNVRGVNSLRRRQKDRVSGRRTERDREKGIEKEKRKERATMMELRIQLIPTGEIILSPGKNGESFCHSCTKVSPSTQSAHSSSTLNNSISKSRISLAWS